MKYLLVLLALVGLYCWAQQPGKPLPAGKPAPAGVTVSPEIYPFPPEFKAPIREYQYESDQLEIENQTLLLKVEKNKERQRELLDAIKQVAFNFASQRKINLDTVDLDPKEVRFIPKPVK